MNELSIIIPVYNEEGTIVEIVRQVLRALEQEKIRGELVIVDDGSVDNTKNLLQNDPVFVQDNVHIIFHSKNKGKGTAIRTAISKVSGEYTIIQDADLEYDPRDAVAMFKHAKEKDLNVLFGSRNMKKDNAKGTFLFYWGGCLLTLITNVLFGQKLTDEATCYKLVRTSVLKTLPLKAKKFEFCPEISALLSLKGVNIPEYPISYNPRRCSEGKKISWKDGVHAVWTLCTLRCIPTTHKGVIIPLFCFLFFGFLLTWHGVFGGYEGETASVAKTIFSGEFATKRAGFVSAILYLPFVFLGKFFLQTPDRFLSIVPIFYSALSMVFFYLCCYVLTKEVKRSVIVTICIAFGSMVWPYVNIGMEYQAMLFVTLLLVCLLYWREEKRSLWLVGIALGLLVGAKSYGIIFVLPAFLFVVVEKYMRGCASNQIVFSYDWISFCVPIGISVLIQGCINYMSHGSLSGVYSLAHEFQVWTWWEGLYGIFFSIGKSIFIYNPLLVVSLFFYPLVFRKDKAIAIFIVTSFTLLLLITAPFSYWTDETWGVRKLVPLLPILHLPLVYFLPKKRIMYGFILIAVLLSCYIQFIGSAFHYGKQLAILREGNMDTLVSMRFIPQLSHITINHSLLLTQIGIKDTLEYQQETWFRWVIGKQDKQISDLSVPLKKYSDFDIMWFEGGAKVWGFRGLLLVESLLLLFLYMQVRGSAQYVKPIN